MKLVMSVTAPGNPHTAVCTNLAKKFLGAATCMCLFNISNKVEYHDQLPKKAYICLVNDYNCHITETTHVHNLNCRCGMFARFEQM